MEWSLTTYYSLLTIDFLCLLHQYLLLIGWSRIAEDDAHEEAIELSLWERVCTLVFERILRSEYNKRRRQIEGLVSDGDAFLLHGFEECGLYLGWCAVDLVSEEDMGEYRSLADFEGSLRLTIDLAPCEVRWQEIRGEGYSTRIETEYACKSPYSLRLAETRNSLEECMSTREECDDELLDEGILTDDLLLDLGFYLMERVVDMSECWVQNNEK
jgi:hypothetical protein